MDDGVLVQHDFYDGICSVFEIAPSGALLNADRPRIERDATYWQDDISYTFERTSRAALDRPTVTCAIPASRLGITELTPAAADYALRRLTPYFDELNAQYANPARPDSENGAYYVFKPSGAVLTRNTAYFAVREQKMYENAKGGTIYEYPYSDEYNLPYRMCLCIRLEIQLPIGKMKRAKRMLCKELPETCSKFADEFDVAGLNRALDLERRQNVIRAYLRENGYAAFIGNGSILPRDKAGDLPMPNALPFVSVPDDEIEICGVRGMGIKAGVTIITGGGYSGKSTVLNAISSGIHNHIEGDGREYCVTDDSAVTITAEDGRAVNRVNISPFIKWIPGGDPADFSTKHASGSTSQAANILEAVSSGAALLLIDEDRSATNFMIRDALMKELITKEPITPFTDRVRDFSAAGVSTILVIGGSGEYLSVADKVYMMDDFVISDVTGRARELAGSVRILSAPAIWITTRQTRLSGFTSYPNGSGTERLEVSETGFIIVGNEKIDIRNLHNVNTDAQINALAFMLRYLMRAGTVETDEIEALALKMRGLSGDNKNPAVNVDALIREMYDSIASDGLNVIDTGFFTTMNRFLELPREIDLRAAIARMRFVTAE